MTVDPKGGALVVRDHTGRGLHQNLEGQRFKSVSRRGRMLIFSLQAESILLVINPKASARLQLCEPGASKPGPVRVTFHVQEPSQELRYVDRRRMGQIYLVSEIAAIPEIHGLGPDALEISREDFGRSLSQFRGEIKSILTHGQLVTGIGNTYADEILWHAGIHPLTERPALDKEQVVQIYESMRWILQDAIAQLRSRIGEEIHLEGRDFMRVHLRQGLPCPRCGTGISVIRANKQITNFCRCCQPGGLIHGLERQG